MRWEKRTPEERFLRDATRGLPRREQAAAQAELRSHIHERAQQLQLLMGATAEAGARERAMRELGPPRLIARSLRRNVHVHPLLSALVLMALAGLVAVPVNEMLWSQWRQGLGVSSSSPAELRKDGYINTTEARRLLRSVGIGLERRGETFYLTHAGLPDAPLGQAALGCEWPSLSSDASSREVFTSMTILACAAHAGWPLKLEGNRVTLNGKVLPVPAADLPVFMSAIYEPVVGEAIKRQLPPALWETTWRASPLIFPVWPPQVLQTQTVRVKVKAGIHVGLLSKLALTNTSVEKGVRTTTTTPAFQIQVAQVNHNGEVTLPKSLRLPRPDRTFNLDILTDLQAWQKAPAGSGAAILIPLSETTTEPVHLTPLRPLE